MKSLLILIILLVTIVGCASTHQAIVTEDSKDESEKIDLAIEMHDNGDYQDAIFLYREILEKNPTNFLALYEISNSYFYLGQYEKSRDYAQKCIQIDSYCQDNAYDVLGSSLDMLGEPEKAIAAFEEGIKLNRKNFILYFNHAITCYRVNRIQDAINSLVNAIMLNPLHPSSHIALAEILLNEGRPAPAILLIFRFLVLEANTERSGIALQMLQYGLDYKIDSLDSGVNDTNDLALADIGNPYSEMEEKRELSHIMNLLDIEAKYPEMQFRLSVVETFLSSIKEEKPGDDPIANHLFPYFASLYANGHAEAFTYYIHQKSEMAGVDEWLDKNWAEIDDFLKWNSDYSWEPCERSTGN